MMDAIEAKEIGRTDPPTCEAWVLAWIDGGSWSFDIYYRKESMELDAAGVVGPVRKFHLVSDASK